MKNKTKQDSLIFDSLTGNSTPIGKNKSHSTFYFLKIRSYRMLHQNLLPNYLCPSRGPPL